MESMFNGVLVFNQTLSCWDFKTDVNVNNIIRNTWASTRIHYIRTDDFNPPANIVYNDGENYFGAVLNKNSTDSDCACPPGSYGDGSTCTPCPAGTVSTEGNSPSCAACPAGSLPSADQKRCIVCARGHTSTANSCEACAAGTYAFGSGSPSCTSCPSGFAQLETGKTSCVECPAGNNAPEGSTSCLTCEPGTYAPATAATCTDCPSGFAQSEAGQGLCVACAADTQAFAGSTQCYTASEMFTHTSQLPSITREMIVNAYNSRNFSTCSS